MSCLSKIAFNKQHRKLLVAEVDKLLYLKSYVAQVDANKKWKALEQAIGWLLHSQQQMEDDGFGTYYLCSGYTSSYPETSGYIVPTLLKYGETHHRPDAILAAQKALDWLLSIQKEAGGWQSGYVHQGREAVVFNTGQVIRGFTAGYLHFKDEKYANAALRAADWIKSVQREDGAFSKHVYLNQARVYDTYVVAPMLELDAALGTQYYTQTAINQAEWVLKNQFENGWFSECDNTVKHNERPIIHTIAYTTDGLLDVGRILGAEKYIRAAEKPAKVLRNIFLSRGILHGRYDKNWSGSEAFITTGGAQLAIIWHKLFQILGEELYREAAEKMNNLLVALQQRAVHEPLTTRGALFGSYPMWGRYEAFACPNWATKYFADSLLNEDERNG